MTPTSPPVRRLPLAVWAYTLSCLSGCATMGSPAEEVHWGGAFGIALVAPDSDAENLPKRTRNHGEGDVPTGFLELGVGDSDNLILSRIAYVRTEHEIDGGYGTGTLEQYMACALYAPRLLGDDTLCFRPLAGFGVGITSFDVPSDTPHDGWDCGQAGFALGAEVDIAQHFTLGTMGWVAIAGAPGDTAGNVATAMFYGGIRF